jgi:Acetyltransferases
MERKYLMELIAITPENRFTVNDFIREHWFSTEMVIRGQIVDMTRVDGYVLFEEGAVIGLVTFMIEGRECEITSLDSLQERRGIGTALLDAAVRAAEEAGCVRVKLITTNDNINAIRFYQKRGFDMAHLYRNALETSRKLKPEIPLIGDNGIPLRHEIEFERMLSNETGKGGTVCRPL